MPMTETYSFPVGPIWRDANVRSAPSLDSDIIELLLPDTSSSYTAVAWTTGENVVEGEIVSDIWFELTRGHWCSAVNFVQDNVRDLPRAARVP
jgi:hypothetical protein